MLRYLEEHEIRLKNIKVIGEIYDILIIMHSNILPKAVSQIFVSLAVHITSLKDKYLWAALVLALVINIIAETFVLRISL